MFLTSSMDGGEWSVSRHGSLIPGERVPASHSTRSWVDSRPGENISGELTVLQAIEASFLGGPTRTQSLYQLSYVNCRYVTYVLHCLLPLCAYRIYSSFCLVTIDPCKQPPDTVKCAVFSETYLEITCHCKISSSSLY